ncbi:nucleotidyltransferase family protein [Leadbetterella sp. DM7]|uniref:nucleotidyltransferase family protein n=1 Tax=Leadbetterella sp. DM7 TaxID=3235085 RepID=UPI00349EFDE8
MRGIGGHFPTEIQTLLLKSALNENNKAHVSFSKWLVRKNLEALNPDSPTFLSDFMDSLDLESQRLLPLVIQNLGENSHPYFKLLRGIRKNFWVRNKQIEYRAGQIQKSLTLLKIPSMKIKGLDYAQNYYDSMALRPMNDGGILIPFNYREKVVKLMEQGYFGNKQNTFSLRMKDNTHAVHLEFEAGIDIGLHWNIFAEYSNKINVSDFIWEKARKEEHNGEVMYKMHDTHAFFLSIIHDRNFDFVPPFRWVADTHKIRQKAEIDWEEVYTLARKFPYKPFLKDSFTYLDNVFHADFPPGFVSKINNLKTTHLENAYYRNTTRNIRNFGFISLAWYGTIRRFIHYFLFLRESDTSLFKYLTSWYYNRIQGELIKD